MFFENYPIKFFRLSYFLVPPLHPLNLMLKAMLTLGTVMDLDSMADMVKDTVDTLVMD